MSFADGRAANNLITVDSMMSRANTGFALGPINNPHQYEETSRNNLDIYDPNYCSVTDSCHSRVVEWGQARGVDGSDYGY